MQSQHQRAYTSWCYTSCAWSRYENHALTVKWWSTPSLPWLGFWDYMPPNGNYQTYAYTNHTSYSTKRYKESLTQRWSRLGSKFEDGRTIYVWSFFHSNLISVDLDTLASLQITKPSCTSWYPSPSLSISISLHFFPSPSLTTILPCRTPRGKMGAREGEGNVRRMWGERKWEGDGVGVFDDL